MANKEETIYRKINFSIIVSWIIPQPGLLTNRGWNVEIPTHCDCSQRLFIVFPRNNNKSFSMKDGNWNEMNNLGIRQKQLKSFKNF